MEKFKFAIAAIILGISLISCGTTPANEKKSKTEAPNIKTTAEQKKSQNFDDEVELVNDEVGTDDEENKRSTKELSMQDTVTKKEFNEDKTEVLRIIGKLQKIMDEENVEEWLKYIDPASKRYYTNPANIRAAQKKLPNKAIILNGIGDYFKYVFIPSRKRSEVKEIRYISKTNIKAVDVKENGGIIVYYYFVKINNKWLVQIPTLN